MKKNRRKRVSRSKTKDRMFNRSVLVIGAVTAVLVIGMGVQTIEMQAKANEYDIVIQELEERVAEEELRTIEIEEFEKYTETDEYVVEVAREKLGMVYPDEIVLIAVE